MVDDYRNKLSPTLLLIVLCVIFACQVCPPLNYALSGRTKQAEVTQVTYDTDIDKDGHFTHVTSVHYRFTDFIPARKSCGIPAQPFERDESANLAPDDPVPAVGDRVTIEYVGNTPGLSRVWHYRDHHQQLMLTLMAMIFAIAALSIYHRNKNTDYQPKWNS
jgi:hypothetical protein